MTTPGDAVEELGKKVDWEKFAPSAGKRKWMQSVAVELRDDLGIQALLGPSGISATASAGERSRVVPDQACLSVLAICAHAQRKLEKTALGIPPCARHLPLLSAATAVLATSLEAQRSKADTAKRGVLLVSPDLDLRYAYNDLFVGAQQINNALPGTRLRSTGERVDLGDRATYDDRGVCFYLPRQPYPERIDFRPSVIFVDARGGIWPANLDKITQWIGSLCAKYRSGVVAFYTLGDEITRQCLCEAGCHDLPIEPSTIGLLASSASNAGGTSPVMLLDFALKNAETHLRRKNKVQKIKNDDGASLLINEIAGMLDQLRDVDTPDVGRAGWILSVLSHLPVPMDYLNYAVNMKNRRSLGALIGGLGSQSRGIANVGAQFQTIRMRLERLVALVSSRNPMCESMKALLSELAPEDEKDIVLLVRDETVRLALQLWFYGDEWAVAFRKGRSRTSIQSFRAYDPGAFRSAQAAIVCGGFTHRYRWIMGGNLSTSVHFLLYPAQLPILRAQLRWFYEKREQLRRQRTRLATLTRLFPIPPASSTEEDFITEDPGTNVSMEPDEVPQQPQKREPARHFHGLLQGLEAVLSVLKKEAEQGEKPQPPVDPKRWTSADQSADEPPLVEDEGITATGPTAHDHAVVRVRSGDGRSSEMRVDVRQRIEYVRPSQGPDLIFGRPLDLQVGDIWIHLDNDGRGSLFDRVIAIAEGHARFASLRHSRTKWKEVIQAMVLRCNREGSLVDVGGSPDYSDLLRKLRMQGATIESATAIRLWVDGSVMAPGSVESIKAVGLYVGDRDLVDNAAIYDKMFNQIRSIHRVIGRQLNGHILKLFRNVKLAQIVPEVPEDPHGLPVQEVLETVDLLEVLAVIAPPNPTAQEAMRS